MSGILYESDEKTPEPRIQLSTHYGGRVRGKMFQITPLEDTEFRHVQFNWEQAREIALAILKDLGVTQIERITS